MEDLKDDEKPDETNGLRRAAAMFAVFIFIFSFAGFSEYFKDYASPFALLIPCLFLLWNVQYFLGKKRSERFDVKDWLKSNGIYILAFLILANVINLLVSASEIVPDSVSKWFIPILIAGSILLLIGYAIRFIEKHSKP